jgi:gamma-glutamyltranspeptidase/glutathione hydrolase
MLSSMTPTIVLRDGKPFLLVGGRGGSRITTGVAHVILNLIDHGMNIQEAVDAPRVHHQWLPDELLYEPRGLSLDTVGKLRGMGYTVNEITEALLGRTHALVIDSDGTFLSGGDPRENGVAIGF